MGGAAWYIGGAIASVNEVLRAISINSDTLGADTPRAEAFAKFVQGLGHGFWACFFEEAFIFDENVNLATGVIELHPYTSVMDAAIAQLEACIEISNANPFVLPATWINGLPLTNTELSQVANSFVARYMAQVARSSTERSWVNWSKVLAHANQGITEDFAPEGDGGQEWLHSVQWFHNDLDDTAARADYKLIGPSDTSGEYQNWLNTPVAQRDEFIMDIGDLRIWDQTLAVDGTQNPGTQFRQIGPTTYPADRGTYHYSRYGWHRYENLRMSGGLGPMPIFLKEEIDFLKSEALLWTGGDLTEVASLIDNTRVANGGYPSAIGAAAGSVTDARSPLPGASLWAMLKYEKGLECLGTGAGIDFFDRRGWDELVTNTPIHFPVPATVTSVESYPNESVPIAFGLDNNYPNPFNPSTTIQFALAKRATVKLKIFDVLGREVITLVDEALGPGTYKVVFYATGLPSGPYFYRIDAGEFVQTKKLMLLK